MKQMAFAALLIVSLTPLTGCAAGPGPTDSFCAVAQPVRPYLPPREQSVTFGPDERPGDYDRLTPATARAMLAHNQIGRALCNW